MPTVGTPLSTTDMDIIFEAVLDRKTNFPDEPSNMIFYLVLSGIGERYRTVQCIEQEWTCLKKDVPQGEDLPTCPNGHALVEGPGMTIGWIPSD